MTAKAEHRAGLELATGRERRCGLAFRGGCLGRLEADHCIEASWLSMVWKQARIAKRLRGRESPLLAVTLDELLADSRNAWWLCSSHNQSKHVAMSKVTREILPASVLEFAAEYGLERYLDRLAAR